MRFFEPKVEVGCVRDMGMRRGMRKQNLVVNDVHIYNGIVGVRNFFSVGIDDDSSAPFGFGNAVSRSTEIEDLGSER